MSPPTTPPLPFSHFLSNPALLLAAVGRRSWDYLTHLPRDKCTHIVHTHVSVTSKHHLSVLFYSSLCSFERTVVINLPLFKKLCELELLIMEISLHITGLFSVVTQMTICSTGSLNSKVKQSNARLFQLLLHCEPHLSYPVSNWERGGLAQAHVP